MNILQVVFVNCFDINLTWYIWSDIYQSTYKDMSVQSIDVQ